MSGFLKPGSQSGGAFGLRFDRPAAEGRGGGQRGAGGAPGASAKSAGLAPFRRDAAPPPSKRRRGDPAPGQAHSSDSSEDGDDAAAREGGGPRGPDLPPMNPTYRYGDASLPVSRYRRQILWLVENHATTIVLGETGSGKTTQVPQFLYEAGWAEGGYSIAVTQPRRVAATGVATRVAEEMGCDVGTTVGYAVRFDAAVDEGRTRIKFVTDGVLLREMMDDPLLMSYSVIMVDEAHERSLPTDVLLGLLKKVQRRRPDLRLIISSATLEADKLAAFFDTSTTTAAAAAAKGAGGEPSRKPAVLSVEGRTHPVQVHYRESPAADYVAAAVEAAVAIHSEDVPGDVLIFLTGQEEVTSAVAQLEEAARRLARGGGYGLRLLPLPLYAGLPGPQQGAALRPPPRGVRKCVVATNVAETSLTIEGVVYVIDSCFVKQRAYNPLTGLEALLVAPVSKAQAAQRAGRAGRMRAGHCFRLCTQAAFEALPEVTVPEMQRSNLTAMVMQLKSLGIDNVMRFEWLAPPPAESMVRALEDLHALGVLDDDARLTRDVGLPLSALPLEPGLGAALLAAVRGVGGGGGGGNGPDGAAGGANGGGGSDGGGYSHGGRCAEELLTIAALMAVPNVWASSAGSTRAFDAARAKFAAAEGDGVTLLNVHRAWRSSGRAPVWAQRHFLDPAALFRADEAREQLLRTLRRYRLLPTNQPPPSCDADMEPVCRALAAGLFPNTAVYDRTEHNPLAAESDPGTHVYRLVRATGQQAANLKLRMHVSSVLWRSTPPCVVFQSAQLSDRGWHEMQGVTAVRPEWLYEVAPHMFKRPGRGGGG